MVNHEAVTKHELMSTVYECKSFHVNDHGLCLSCPHKIKNRLFLHMYKSSPAVTIYISQLLHRDYSPTRLFSNSSILNLQTKIHNGEVKAGIFLRL